MLPDMDGYNVRRWLRTARIQTPVLSLSGLGAPNAPFLEADPALAKLALALLMTLKGTVLLYQG